MGIPMEGLIKFSTGKLFWDIGKCPNTDTGLQSAKQACLLKGRYPRFHEPKWSHGVYPDQIA